LKTRVKRRRKRKKRRRNWLRNLKKKKNEDDFRTYKYKKSETNAVSFFVKNIEGLILLNKGIRKIYLGFKVLLYNKKEKPKPKIYEDDEEIDPLDDLPLPVPNLPVLVGWYYYELSNSQGKIRNFSSSPITMYAPPMLKLPFKKRAVKTTDIQLRFTYKNLKYEMASLPFFADMRIKAKKVETKPK
jgi:hypothetical protein